MVHRKHYHEDKVGDCRSYSKGTCTYSRETCWWKHDKCFNEGEFSCSYCEKTFVSRSDLMKHRKNKHIEEVESCTYARNGSCHFSNQDCWFIHEENIPTDKMGIKDQNEDIIEKLFTMMEKFSARLMKIENTK